MPVPRFISASCGIAIRIRPDKKEEVERLFKEGSALEAGEYAYYHIEIGSGSEDAMCEKLEI